MEARAFLSAKVAEKKIKNPRFSIRAWAKKAGISPATLSQVLSGKRALARATALKLANSLNLSEEERTRFFSALVENRGSLQKNPREKNGGDWTLRQLSEEEYRQISDWYHYVILSLADMPSSDLKNSAWVSSRLGISYEQAERAIELLIRLGALKVTKDKIVASTEGLTSTHDLPSESIRRNHKQLLRRAEDALDLVPVHERDFSSVTFSFDPKNLVKAKKLIKEFRRRFWKLMEKGKNPSEVYALTLQFFPLTQKQQNSKGHL